MLSSQVIYLLSGFSFLPAILTLQLDSTTVHDLSGAYDITGDSFRHTLPASIKGTLDRLKNLETQPSCVRVATAGLFHSCAHLDGSVLPDDDEAPGSPDAFIMEEVDVYSARLAVCEWSVAKPALVPSACKDFVPTVITTKKKVFGWSFSGQASSKQPYPQYDAITRAQLESCRSSLADNDRTWTSFSNSKQNAVAMCHAMRGEVERNETIHMYKVFAYSMADLGSAVSLSTEELEDFRVSFRELKLAMRQSHLDMVQNDEQRREKTLKLWGEWEARMEADLEVLRATVNGIAKSAREAGTDVSNSKRYAQEALSSVNDGIGALSIRQKEVMREAEDSVVQYAQAVNYLNEVIEQGITQALLKANLSLHTTNSLVLDLHAQMANVSLLVQNISIAALDAERLHGSIRSISELVTVGWAGLLQRAANVLIYTTIIALLSIGCWLKFMGLVGSICASIATGAIAGGLLTTHCDPATMIAYLPPPEAIMMLLAYAGLIIAASTLLAGILGCVCHLFTGRWIPRRTPQSPRQLDIEDHTAEPKSALPI
ncbi:hypothetical protein KC340_g5562 [Hortaea werneckii]|nr:hypothetical protein KC342_g5828 [Hortaea werneckii]KAI7099967.1 hypothetical protein KC339_g7833 [Hortaea werneckii]KAI7216845.1 hypothetical protein KC365_g13120 [Hortaea werneckii]KAI7327553.1 hypothetical protein KC340_g5562 [Hortaea werneckii]KAI7382608.1 hypothetical protein KC328_g11688 [Hortaea werneckii]